MMRAPYLLTAPYAKGAALRALQDMVKAEQAEEYEDAEIVCDGWECWLGERRTSWGVVYRLLEVCAVADVSDVKGCTRYTLNETGRLLAANPNYIPPIVRATGGDATV